MFGEANLLATSVLGKVKEVSGPLSISLGEAEAEVEGHSGGSGEVSPSVHVQNSSQYVSQYVFTGDYFHSPVFQIRDADTGDVFYQYPTENVLQVQALQEERRLQREKEATSALRQSQVADAYSALGGVLYSDLSQAVDALSENIEYVQPSRAPVITSLDSKA